MSVNKEVSGEFLLALSEELPLAYIRQQIKEMHKIRFHEGPFKAGWDGALEEIETSLGFPCRRHDVTKESIRGAKR